MKLLLTLILASTPLCLATRLRGSENLLPSPIDVNHSQRDLTVNHYYSTSDPTVLGEASFRAAIGNPLKGLLTSPEWTGQNTPDTIPSSLEFHYIGLDSVMTGNNQFDWTALDKTLSDATSRNNHVIWRFFVHYPGQPLRIPQYLITAGVKLVPIQDGSVSPQYDDPILMEAFQQFITALGQRYDGNKAIGFIQLGLLGYWGEWHTFPDEGLISPTTADTVVGWYAAAFKTTRLQSRAPLTSVFAAGIGLHDDSFAYSTLGSIDWFFWPQIEEVQQTSFWKKGAMGGETRPELQATVFEPTYIPGSDDYKQDFMTCVETTHATYMFHHAAFEGTFSEEENEKARVAHSQMGYSFQVTNVGVSAAPGDNALVSVDVTVKQTGVAPFYYPLILALNCPGTSSTVAGVEGLIETGSSKVFSFIGIPADSNCLQNIKISLESEFAHTGRPIRFAQGTDGQVLLKLPSPENNVVATQAPVVPTQSPVVATAAPVSTPTSAPVVVQSVVSTQSAPVGGSDETLQESITNDQFSVLSWAVNFFGR